MLEAVSKMPQAFIVDPKSESGLDKLKPTYIPRTEPIATPVRNNFQLHL